jgi:hypothetical protein
VFSVVAGETGTTTGRETCKEFSAESDRSTPQ